MPICIHAHINLIFKVKKKRTKTEDSTLLWYRAVGTVLGEAMVRESLARRDNCPVTLHFQVYQEEKSVDTWRNSGDSILYVCYCRDKSDQHNFSGLEPNSL